MREIHRIVCRDAPWRATRKWRTAIPATIAARTTVRRRPTGGCRPSTRWNHRPTTETTLATSVSRSYCKYILHIFNQSHIHLKVELQIARISRLEAHFAIQLLHFCQDFVTKLFLAIFYLDHGQIGRHLWITQTVTKVGACGDGSLRFKGLMYRSVI